MRLDKITNSRQKASNSNDQQFLQVILVYHLTTHKINVSPNFFTNLVVSLE